MIKEEQFRLGLSNLVHILVMTRTAAVVFKVRGQRSR